MKKIIIVILFMLIALNSAVNVFAQEDKPSVELFYSLDCEYCQKAIKVIDSLDKNKFDYKQYEVSNDRNNRKIFLEFIDNNNLKSQSIPVLAVGKQIIIGFSNDKDYTDLIADSLKNNNQEQIRYAQLEGGTCEANSEKCTTQKNTIKLPIFGQVDLNKYSLPVATIILGLADGFNPCAMWALIALISILLTLDSRKKLLLIGGLFIVFSYLIYVFYMSALLNILSLLDFIKGLQILVGITAFILGINYIRDFIRTDPTTCKIVKKDKKTSLIEQAKRLISNKSVVIGIIGVGILAIAVNTIEVVCSVGIPVIYTKLLSDADLSKAQFYSYIASYNIFYMLDDIIVFSVAVVTKQIITPSPKVGYWARLIGGILLVILGIIFIIKPELLNL